MRLSRSAQISEGMIPLRLLAAVFEGNHIVGGRSNSSKSTEHHLVE